ncbi:MAG TPA: alkaline phosphatase family protein [Candidatus Bathyarchaeia archaeon]|nr:alkaline phosphatase family protein [Candidatus Bathyarchaeia archaeon]
MKYTQLDIAPTISSLLGFEIPDKDGGEIQEIIAYCKDKSIDQILLIVIDGVGASLYKKLESAMARLRVLSESGLFFEIRSLPPRITTPNIGTILTGYTPEHHRLYEVADTFYTRVKSILEIASDNGIKSGIVVELLGAKAMLNRVDLAIGVENLHGIIDYDRRITDLSLKAFSLEGIRLLMMHLRAIDNCAHHYAEAWEDLTFSARTIDENLERIYRDLHRSTLILVTSDHPIHVEKWAHLEEDNPDVPLIACYVDAPSGSGNDE